QEFLAANAWNWGTRDFHVVAACDDAQQVVGLSVFSYVPASNCGFSEYIVVAREVRGTGLGRALFDRRKAILDAGARLAGRPRCRGLFIEAEDPRRMPPEHVTVEQETAIDPVEGQRIVQHLGFWRVEVPYVQPPLAEDKEAVEYL